MFLGGPTQMVAAVTVDVAVLDILVGSLGRGPELVSTEVATRPVTLIERSFRERIVLVGVVFPWTSPETVDADLDELALLVDTAGADVVGRVVQRRDRPDPATFVGRGKAAGAARDVSEPVDSDTVVFDDELSPAQQRNLEKILGRTAIDRTAVILDIFAQNARQPGGQGPGGAGAAALPAAPAAGPGTRASQQAGGIGTRGPGETQLEVDRRRLLRRMTAPRGRSQGGFGHPPHPAPVPRCARASGWCALVGYTNAGKSTLLNRLTDAGVLVEDRLFSTLDPTTRRLALPGGETVLLSDTVGFVRKLPHQLVEAFRSTLEEVKRGRPPRARGGRLGPRARAADRRRASRARRDRRRGGARAAGDQQVPIGPRAAAARLRNATRGRWWSRPAPGRASRTLVQAIGDRLRIADRLVELLVPFDRGDVLAAVHREGEVVDESHGEGATVVHVVLDDAGRARFREFLAS